MQLRHAKRTAGNRENHRKDDLSPVAGFFGHPRRETANYPAAPEIDQGRTAAIKAGKHDLAQTSDVWFRPRRLSARTRIHPQAHPELHLRFRSWKKTLAGCLKNGWAVCPDLANRAGGNEQFPKGCLRCAFQKVASLHLRTESSSEPVRTLSDHCKRFV